MDSRKNNCEDSLPQNRLAERAFQVDLLQVIPERILYNSVQYFREQQNKSPMAADNCQYE